MPVYSIQYVRGRGEELSDRARAFAGLTGGCVQLKAPDRVAAFAAAVKLFALEPMPIFVAPRSSGNPLGFSGAELAEVAALGLSLSTEIPRGEAIQVERVEIHQPYLHQARSHDRRYEAEDE